MIFGLVNLSGSDIELSGRWTSNMSSQKNIISWTFHGKSPEMSYHDREISWSIHDKSHEQQWFVHENLMNYTDFLWYEIAWLWNNPSVWMIEQITKTAFKDSLVRVWRFFDRTKILRPQPSVQFSWITHTDGNTKSTFQIIKSFEHHCILKYSLDYVIHSIF